MEVQQPRRLHAQQRAPLGGGLVAPPVLGGPVEAVQVRRPRRQARHRARRHCEVCVYVYSVCVYSAHTTYVRDVVLGFRD